MRGDGAAVGRLVAVLEGLASCPHGGHAIWWSVDAATAAEPLALLPYHVGERPV
jgi:hypothetical protein